MKVHSAGLVVYRQTTGEPEVLLAHMGSPWWAKKDIGAWTIPKGTIEAGEEPLEAARREFMEELGVNVPEGDLIELGDIQQHNNKTVTAWALEADVDVSNIKSNKVKIEWPPRSGKTQEFPEIDRAAWFSLPVAAQKSVRGQAELFQRLANILQVPFGPEVIPEPPVQPSLF
jgi:predicted NUDIX family NTP pyrophosphohydrolase